jgi:hypothetical protein
MKKIPSVFCRNYDTDRRCRDEVVDGCEWVLAGEGVATIKWDGTACMIRDGQLFKRYDRKRNRKTGEYKPAPPNWEACEPKPNEHTGHWPGWLPVGDGPEDRWHREAFEGASHSDGTYELLGPKVQGNPYGLKCHMLQRHGTCDLVLCADGRTFRALRAALESTPPIEGIVFHHPDGRMAKVKRRDFGLPWPVVTR